MNWFEVVGYAASALVALSLTMRSVVRLRMFGLAGSTLFAVYGVLIGAVPIVITNVVIMGINSYFLWTIYRSPDYFTLLEVQADSAYMLRFLDFYRDDIDRFIPGFTFRPVDGQFRLFVLRDMVPAGLLIADPGPTPDVLEVRLDYVIPQYRDYKAGRFIYSRGCELFGTHGFRRLVSDPGAASHRDYLTRMGFEPSGDRWSLDLAKVSGASPR